jgi:hypothetical protein
MVDPDRLFWEPQARNGHEPRTIREIGPNVAALQMSHRCGNELSLDRRTGAMPTGRERLNPDVNQRQPLCNLDPFDRAGPPTALAKANHPHPNGCRESKLRQFSWLHRLGGSARAAL